MSFACETERKGGSCHDDDGNSEVTRDIDGEWFSRAAYMPRMDLRIDVRPFFHVMMADLGIKISLLYDMIQMHAGPQKCSVVASVFAVLQETDVLYPAIPGHVCL